MSKVEELHLNPEAFNKMPNLRFLKFYWSEHGKKVPESDSSTFRCILSWLKRENSNDGKKVHGFEKLKFDFYGLRYFCFDGYPAKSLPPNFNPKNLVALYMPNSKVKKLWTGNQVLVNLKHIDLRHSKHLCRIPDFSLMPNLESLNLEDCTNLLESFSSIHNLHKLVILHLQGCKSLKNLSISSNCQSLREVNLSNCSNLKKVLYLPNKVDELYLDRTAIKEIPTFMASLINLKTLSLTGLGIPLIDLSVFQRMRELHLIDCCIEVLPNNIGELLSLVSLELDQNNLETLPESIKDLSNLDGLYLSNCQRLKYLPELPSSLRQICAEDCVSLESISSLFLCVDSFTDIISFANCFKLKLEMTDAALLNVKRSAADYLCDILHHRKVSLHRGKVSLHRRKNIIPFQPSAYIYYPGCEIPKWFDLKSNGSFIKFPEGWVNDNLIGFALCAVVLQDYQKLGIFKVGFHLIVNGKTIFSDYLMYSSRTGVDTDHVIIRFYYIMTYKEFPPQNLNSQGGVEFFVEHATKNGMVRSPVKKCGVTLLYHKNDDCREDPGVDKNDERPCKRLKLEG